MDKIPGTSNLLALLFCIQLQATAGLTESAHRAAPRFPNVHTITVGVAELTTPAFTPPGEPAFETDLAFGIENINEGSSTEIYRRDPSGEWILVHTNPPGENNFLDKDLKPRTTYSYRLRAVKDGAFSEYSNVLALTTMSNFFDPYLTAAADERTVTLTLEDRSYYDASYEIYRMEEGSANRAFVGEIFASDSGSVQTFTDSGVLPEKKYTYSIDVITQGEGQPRYFDVASATVTTGSDDSQPVVTGFSLIDPVTDHELRGLTDGDMVDPTPKPNIRANANSITSSIVFFLNGAKRTENEAPYAYFYDTKGDYYPGRLKEGHYTLEATPFSENNGQGTRGKTLKIEFMVTGDGGALIVESFMIVDPYTDTAIKALQDGDVVDGTNRLNISAIAGKGTESVVMYLNGNKRIENEAPYAYFYDTWGDYNPGRLNEGQYTLEATPYSDNDGQGVKGKTLTITFTVENSAEAMAAEARTKTHSQVKLYPNPIVKTAIIEISDKPRSNVLLEVYDQNGNNTFITHKGLTDESGYLAKEFDATGLKQGTYIMRVRVNEQVTTRRFTISK